MAAIMAAITKPLLALDEDAASTDMPAKTGIGEEENHMKIAIPLANGILSMHFGHCEQFALIDVDPAEKKILGRKDLEAPPHEPGLLPTWLAEQGATMIIAGGMGQRAQELFKQRGIHVMVGAPSETPERLVAAYLDGTLQTGANVCDH